MASERGWFDFVLETDAQEGQVKRVEHELHLPAGQGRVDLVTVAVQ